MIYNYNGVNYFHLHPNFKKLSKYYTLPKTLPKTGNDTHRCFMVDIDSWQSNEVMLSKLISFNRIFKDYDLTEAQDDIMYLLLTKFRAINEVIIELENEYKQKSRVIELLNFLEVLQATNDRNKTQLSITSITDKAKVTDNGIIGWVNDAITQMIIKKQIPLNLFGHYLLDLGIDTSSNQYTVNGKTLKEFHSELDIKSPRKEIKQQKADFCLETYTYLTKETHIKPDSKAVFSDRLLKFYFEILELFDYVKELDIDSEPKDYARSLLWNRIKQLNHSLSGK